MEERNPGGMKQHAAAMQMLPKKQIMLPISMRGVSDDGVAYMLEMPPDLMIPARQWPCLY